MSTAPPGIEPGSALFLTKQAKRVGWMGGLTFIGSLLPLSHGRPARGRFRAGRGRIRGHFRAMAALYWLYPSMQHRPERLGYSSSLASPV